jgi:hypothetical protein
LVVHVVAWKGEDIALGGLPLKPGLAQLTGHLYADHRIAPL